MSEFRQAFFWAFIGTTGTGKTTSAVEIAKHWKRNHKGCKIIGFDPHEVFVKEKLLDNFIQPSDEFWASRLCQKDKQGNYKFSNSLLILDDYRSLLTGNHVPADVLDLIMLRRKLCMDVIYIVHSPKLILERFSYYTNMYSIFYTESTASDFSERIPSFSICQRAANLVNKYVRDIGGVESDAYRSKYPNFPYALVETKNNTSFETFNMGSVKHLYET